MSEWRGLHNPEQHRPSWNHVTAWCDCGRLGVQCTTGYPCRCCLAAEVERLTALLKAADDVVASQDRRIAAALGMLDAELKYERNLGTHLSLTQISDVLRGETDE